MVKSMYIHVPFCDSICAYCDFERCRSHPALMKKWLTRIIKEIDERKDEPIETLYIGGGTPSSLCASDLKKLLQTCACFKQVKEFTIEANIENLTDEKIDLLVQYGVNRISLGIQTLQDDLLQIIERHHTKAHVFEALERIYKKGIHNISVDLIYGLPTQTLKAWQEDLTTLASHPYISHVSIYSLTIEENSALKRRGIEKVNEELDEEMYFEAIRILEEYGFEQYEISNFARHHRQSQHNLSYWNYDDFIGIGCGAYGKENHVYYHHKFRLDLYLQNKDIKEKTPLSLNDERFEFVMMGLRLKKGIDCLRFEDLFHEKIENIYGEAIQKHQKMNHLIQKDHYLLCSEQGFALLNDILIDFMD